MYVFGSDVTSDPAGWYKGASQTSSAFSSLLPPHSPLGSCHGDWFNPNKLIYLSISASPIIWCGLWSNPGAELCEEERDRTYLTQPNVHVIAGAFMERFLWLIWNLTIIIILIYFFGRGWVMQSGGGKVWVSTPNVAGTGPLCLAINLSHLCVCGLAGFYFRL